MRSDVSERLRRWAAEYHTAAFVANDPVQFPHRFAQRRDIEISGLLTALMSFGNRKQIVLKADALHAIMGVSPYDYVMSLGWQTDFQAGRKESFYRMLMYADFNGFFQKLHDCYARFDSLEDCLLTLDAESPFRAICQFMQVSDKSPQKKLNMFLRWMIRRDSEVDFGLWQKYSPSQLIIPLDVHVCRQAFELGLIDKETFSLANARKITDALASIFPGDPCLGDFALFGYGVNNK